MAITKTNSSFKIKCSVHASHLGVVPEKGAMMFIESENTIVIGDGFNWLPIGPQAATKDAIAIRAAAPIVNAVVAATPLAPIDFFDTVVYQVGTDITATPDNTINFAAAYNIDFASQFQISADVANVSLTWEILLGGVSSFSRSVELKSAGTYYQQSVVGGLVIAAPVALTARFTSDKTCNLTIINGNYGCHEIT